MKFLRRLSSLTAFLLAVLSGASLFWVSQQVQQVEREQRKLIASIESEEESIRVLRAEWDYLNRPERLEALSVKYLNMKPVSVDTLVQSISAIPEPEEPSAPVEVSTAAPAKVEHGKPASAVLPPPVLNQNEVSQEDEFSKVLDHETEGGQ